MTVDMPCECTHPKSEHAGLEFACWGCDCKRYIADIPALSKADIRVAANAAALAARVARDQRNKAWTAWAVNRFAPGRDHDAQVKLRRRLADAQDELMSARIELKQLREQLGVRRTP